MVTAEHKPTLSSPGQRAVRDCTGPIPMKLTLSLLTEGTSYGKHSDNTLKYPYLIHLYSPGELVNVLFIMGA